MPDWVADHRDSIRFVTLLTLGVGLIAMGVFGSDEKGLIALGAGIIGVPGVTSAQYGGTPVPR